MLLHTYSITGFQMKDAGYLESEETHQTLGLESVFLFKGTLLEIHLF